VFPTVEVRWFGTGAVPAEVQRWFQGKEHEAEAQPPRTDHYLRLGRNEDLGVKLREGRIEIKQRQRDFGLVRFHPQIAGRVEQWRKWSLSLAGGEGHLADILVPASAWIAVHKVRRVHTYQVAAGTKVGATPAGTYPGWGCNLELAELTVGDEPWWTLGLEAFGPEVALRETLLLVADQAFSHKQAPTLRAADSYAYPLWLAQIAPDDPSEGISR